MTIGFSRALALAFAGGLLSPAAWAENLTIGNKGAIYCKNTDDLAKQVESALAGTHATIPGCGVLSSGAIIDASTLKKTDQLIAGIGTSPGILGGASFAFMAVPSGADSSGAAARESPAGDPAGTAAALERTRDPVRVSGADLSVQTHKWVGKVIETKANCFYADLNEFRCFSSRFRVDFERIFPPSTQSAIERECDTISKSGRRACSVALRFEYVDYAPMDVPGLAGRFNVVRAKDNVGFIVKK